MKVKIIENVIVKGKRYEPGIDEPRIVDLDKDVAENLIRIGCAVDPTKKGVKSPAAVSEKVFAAKEQEIEDLKGSVADLKGKLDELMEYTKELEKERDEKNETIEQLKAELSEKDQKKADPEAKKK